MAWSNVAIGDTNFSKTSGTTLVITLGLTITVGQVLCIHVAADNIGAADSDAGTETSCADSKGNSYTKIRERVNGSPGAGAGATAAMFFTKVTTQLVSGDTVTITFSSAVTAKAATTSLFSIGAGNTVTVDGQASGTPEEATTAPSATISGITAADRLWIACTAVEGPTGDTLTEDSAPYTSTTRAGTTGGGAATNMTVNGAWKIQSVASDTYNPTLGTARDCAQVFAVLKEAAAGTQFNQSLSASMSTFDGTITKRAGKSLGASMSTFAGTTAKQTNKSLVASMSTFAATVVKQTNHVLDASMSTFSAVLAESLVFVKDLAASMSTFAGTLIKQTNKTLAASMSTFAGTTARQTSKLLPAGMSTFSGVVAKRTSRALDASMSTFSAILAESLTSVEALNASMSSFAGALATLFIPSSPSSGLFSWVGPTVRSFLKRGSA